MGTLKLPWKAQCQDGDLDSLDFFLFMCVHGQEIHSADYLKGGGVFYKLHDYISFEVKNTRNLKLM